MTASGGACHLGSGCCWFPGELWSGELLSPAMHLPDCVGGRALGRWAPVQQPWTCRMLKGFDREEANKVSDKTSTKG